jgi:hypothetical protein
MIKRLIESINFPVFINSFNRPTYLKSIIQQFNKYLIKPIIIDNNSSNPEVIDYLNKFNNEKFFLIRFNQNLGHNVIFIKDIYDHLPNYFAYTDCDIKLNDNLPKNFLKELSDLTNIFRSYKAGFALDINSANLKSLKNKFGNNIKEWESHFWAKQLKHHELEIFSAAIDTTFAVYNRQNENLCGGKKKHNAIRVAGKYTAIHLPWMKYDPMPDSELKFYMENDSKNISTWSSG